jgi:hypothetical protein
MAYDTIAQAAPATTTSPNEVAILIYMGADTTIYTVPEGKIFKGWIIGHSGSTSPTYTYTPGSVSTTAHSIMGNAGGEITGTLHHTSTGFENKWPMMMNALDTLKRASSHNWTLMGLETTVNTVSWDTSS